MKQFETKLYPADGFRPFPDCEQRDFWNRLPRQERDRILAEAEGVLGYQWKPMLAGKMMGFAKTGDRKEFEDDYFEIRYVLAMLVLAECIEGAGRFLPQVIDGIWCVCEQTTWALPAHFYLSPEANALPCAEAEPIVDLFAGETAQLLSIARYLLKNQLDSVTPVISERIRQECMRRVVEPYLRRDDLPWQGFVTPVVNNWCPWCTSNCLLAGLLLLEDGEKRMRLAQKAVRSLNVFMDGYGQDGGCDEGPSYWDRAAGSLLECLELLSSATGGAFDQSGDEKLRRMAEFIRSAAILPDRFANFADAGASFPFRSDLVYRFGAYLKDPALTAFAASAERSCPKRAGDPKSGVSIWRELRRLEVLPELLSIREEASPEKTVWMEDIEVLVARTTARYGEGLVLAAKFGTNGESHNHNDVGSFLLYKDGRPVFIDVGVGIYTAQTFSDRRYEIWTMQSQYHNTPLPSGQGQQAGIRYRAEAVRFERQDGAVTVSGELAGAYGLPSLERWRRTFTLAPDGAVIIRDAYRFEPEGEATFVFMTAEPPVVGGNELSVAGAVMTWDAGSAAAVTEKISISDEKLMKNWGNAVYRTVIKQAEPVCVGETVFMIR